MTGRSLLISAALWLAPVPAPAPPAHRAAVVVVRFSPGGHCSDAIVAELAAARRTVRVAAYVLTSGPISAALVAAHARGVDVRVVLDSEERRSRSSRAAELEAAGVPVKYDAKHRIMHEKVIVIDGNVVICGSYNFSAAAESYNAECMLIIRNEGLAGEFARDWAVHDGHGEPR
jgi:phosphatidylserine/phosphatidylglycerophosphate/cardiolipin synthase-like enzyme